MLDLSFRPNLPPLLRGGPDDVHTLVHYKHFIFGSEKSTDAYNYVDIGVFFNTIFTAILVTIINLCFCYPIAFYMAKIARPNSARLLIVSLIKFAIDLSKSSLAELNPFFFTLFKIFLATNFW